MLINRGCLGKLIGFSGVVGEVRSSSCGSTCLFTVLAGLRSLRLDVVKPSGEVLYNTRWVLGLVLLLGSHTLLLEMRRDEDSVVCRILVLGLVPRLIVNDLIGFWKYCLRFGCLEHLGVLVLNLIRSASPRHLFRLGSKLDCGAFWYSVHVCVPVSLLPSHCVQCFLNFVLVLWSESRFELLIKVHHILLRVSEIRRIGEFAIVNIV